MKETLREIVGAFFDYSFALFDLVAPLISAFNQWPTLWQYALGAAMFLTGALIYGLDALIKRQRHKKVLIHDPNIPKELLNGRLISSEKHFACRRPRKMHGTPDRVYKNHYGRLLPVDVKTRASQRVQQTDVVQLSVYAQILKKQGRVEDYGYIRFDSNATAPVYAKVDLLSTKEVCKLYDRHKLISAGKVQPYGAKHAGMCKGCGHHANCQVKPI